jgi:hypothetical protein
LKIGQGAANLSFVDLVEDLCDVDRLLDDFVIIRKFSPSREFDEGIAEDSPILMSTL